MNDSPVGQKRASDRLLRKSDVAENFQVSLRSVDRWIARGEIEVVRLGRSVRITESALRKFLLHHKA
jgi:excisionase family DNA binding protein